MVIDLLHNVLNIESLCTSCYCLYYSLLIEEENALTACSLTRTFRFMVHTFSEDKIYTMGIFMYGKKQDDYHISCNYVLEKLLIKAWRSPVWV